MQYNISSKTSIYKDRIYRSRLEARWACMFDLLGWTYDYEPFDFKGWHPDFIVYGTKSNILFEVKPYIDKEVKDEYLIKINKGTNIIDERPACIILDNFTTRYFNGPLYAGVQVKDKCNYLNVHWKSHQDGEKSHWDIGSTEGVFDGILWEDTANRKQFAQPSYGIPFLFQYWEMAGNRVKDEII